MEDLTKPINETRTLLDIEFAPTLEQEEAVYERVVSYDEKGEVAHTRTFSIKKKLKTESQQFEEQEHPREEDGKFTTKGNGKPKKNISPVKSKKAYKQIQERIRSFREESYDFVSSNDLDSKYRIKGYQWDATDIVRATLGGYNIAGFKEEIDYVKNMWKEMGEKNPSIKKGLEEILDHVEDWNKKSVKAFNENESFFRGTDIDELRDYLRDGIIGSGKEEDERIKHLYYDFTAVTPIKNIASIYAKGVVIEYDGDDVRKKGEPVKYDLWWRDNSTHKETKKDGVMDAYYMDQMEVRMDKTIPLKEMKIKNIYLASKYKHLYKELSKLGNVVIRGGHEAMINENDIAVALRLFNNYGLDEKRITALAHQMARWLGMKYDVAVQTLQYVSKLKANEEFVEQEHPRDDDGKFTSIGKSEDRITSHLDPDKKKLWNVLQDKKEELKKFKDIEYYVNDPSIKKENDKLREDYQKLNDDLHAGLITDEEYRRAGRVLEKKEFALSDKKIDIRFDPKHDDISEIDTDSYELMSERIKNGQPLSDFHKKLQTKVDRITNDLRNKVKDGEIKTIGIKKPNDKTLVNYYNSRVKNNLNIKRLERRLEERVIEEKEAWLVMGGSDVEFSDGSMTMHGGRVLEDDHPINKYHELVRKYGDIEYKKERAISNLVQRMKDGKKEGKQVTVTNDDLAKKYDNEWKMYKKMQEEIPVEDKKFMDDIEKVKKTLHKDGKVNSTVLNEEWQDMKLRGNNEYLTPLVNKNQHMYVINNDGEVPESHINHLYKMINSNQRFILWSKNNKSSFEKNDMNYELISGDGESFHVGDEKFTTGAHWSKNSSTIRFFNSKIHSPKYSFYHENAHAMFDAFEERIEDAYNADKKYAKQGAFNTFKREVEKISYDDAKELIGGYFASYVKSWKSGIRSGLGANIHTEAFSNITDTRYGKRSAYEGYRKLKIRYPKLVSAYEKLYGDDGFHNLGESFGGESLSKKDNKTVEREETFYLDNNYNFVDKSDSDIILRVGYNYAEKIVEKKSFYVTKKTDESFKEEEHPRDKDGKFTNSGKISDFKEKLKARVEPNKKVRALQKEVHEEIDGKIWKAIDELGIRDKVIEVAMQGSYEKGTDLPTSGSDLDIFMVFDTDVPEEERERLGVEIGLKALDGKDPYIKDATTKYAEAFFDHKGQEMEVQIVPTRHLTLQQIKDKSLNGEPISIGMERTPHQTKYMKEALKGKEHEVRMLKQFMKDTGLYDSSMKSQGFSGYSAEVLIDKFDTFEDTLKFFSNLKEGDIVDKHGEGKRNEQNIFSLIDPIDPNRDLISAFSTFKIGKTVKTAKYFLEHGEQPPKPKTTELETASITYKTTQKNEDTLTGQVRKTQKSIVGQLKKLGFDIDVNIEKVNDFDVEVPRTMALADDEGNVTMTFGTNNLEIPATYKDKGVPLTIPKAVDAYRKSNSGSEFIEEEGRLKAVKKRPFTHLADAIKYLSTDKKSQVQQTAVINDMANGVKTSTGKQKFENLI